MTGDILVPAFPLQVAGPRKRYPAVNRCIYCGAFSRGLGDEHIIPYGLAGNSLVLPKSSCTECASITGLFEQACLRAILGPFRIRVGAPTRRPNERPERLHVVLAQAIEGKPHVTGIREIQSDHFPLAFLGLRLRLPGILEGAAASGELRGDIWTRINLEEAKSAGLMPTEGPPGGFRIGQMHPLMFGRMLAKIAYSHAVAELGYGSFEPLVTGLIRGKTDTMCHWVGGDWEIPSAEPVLHRLQVARVNIGARRFVIVAVRLFCFFGTPQYQVVVGEHLSEPPQA